jgi:hypothetical protein
MTCADCMISGCDCGADGGPCDCPDCQEEFYRESAAQPSGLPLLRVDYSAFEQREMLRTYLTQQGLPGVSLTIMFLEGYPDLKQAFITNHVLPYFERTGHVYGKPPNGASVPETAPICPECEAEKAHEKEPK